MSGEQSTDMHSTTATDKETKKVPNSQPLWAMRLKGLIVRRLNGNWESIESVGVRSDRPYRLQIATKEGNYFEVRHPPEGHYKEVDDNDPATISETNP